MNQSSECATQNAQVATAENCCETTTSTRKQTVEIRPRADVVEYADHFVMTLDIPGVAKDSVDVSLEKGVLSVEGTAAFQVPEGHQIVSGQPFDRKYSRSFKLSDQIDRDGIEVEHVNGTLRVRLPKTEAGQKVKLEVKSNSAN